jgi:hypothetical protein
VSQERFHENVRNFSNFHFPFSAKDLRRSESYVNQLLPGAVSLTSQPANAGALLERICAEIIEEEAPSDILIPLSAGKDSRSILAATLKVYPKSRIRCVTWGEPLNEEVAGAERVCKTLKLEHHRVDPRRHDWSLDSSTERVRHIYKAQGVYSGYFKTLSEASLSCTGSGTLVLSGYLGDSTTGKELAHGGFENARRAVDRYILLNTACQTATTERAKPFLENIIERHFAHYRDRGYTQLTRLDLIDLFLTEALHIRSVTVLGDARVRAPLAHPQWLSYWYNRPLGARLGQLEYTATVRSRYPNVFSLPKDRKAIGDTSLTVSERLKRKARHAVLRNLYTSERGDFRTSRKQLHLVEQALQSFLNRNIPIDYEVAALAANVRAHTRGHGRKLIDAVVNTEIHIRAGNLRAS